MVEPEPVHVYFHGFEATGRLTLLGNTSGVARIGSILTGLLTVSAVSVGCRSLWISLEQRYFDSDAASAGDGSAPPVFLAEQEIRLGGPVDPTEAQPFQHVFNMEIPLTALPSLDRSGFIDNDNEKTMRVSTSHCFIGVCVYREGNYRKILGHQQLTLISSIMPNHLSHIENTREWSQMTNDQGVTYRLRLLDQHVTIGGISNFVLESTNGFASVDEIELVSLYESTLFSSESKAKETLDRFLFSESASKVETIRGSMPLWQQQQQLQAGRSTSRRSLDLPGGHRAHSVEQSLPQFALNLKKQKLENGGILLSITIPADTQHQSCFSNTLIFNFWKLHVKVGQDELSFCPLPVIWSPQVVTNTLRKHHHTPCEIL